MTKHVHNWRPLFERPTEGDTEDMRIGFMLWIGSRKRSLVTCDCGAVGHPRNNGTVQVWHGDDALVQGMITERVTDAAKWAAQLAESRTGR